MKIETELKYKIDRLPSINFDKKMYLEQTYFNGEKNEEELLNLFNNIDLSFISTYRVRLVQTDKEKYYQLTLKEKGAISRKEYECVINEKQAQGFLKNSIDKSIIKNRLVVSEEGFTFEFDEYLNLRSSLYTVEIELENINQIFAQKNAIEKILKDKWNLSFNDVSNDFHYKNVNLHKYF